MSEMNQSDHGRVQSTLQLGVRLHDMADEAFPARLACAAQQGFTCVHLALKKIPDLPDTTESLTPGYAAVLRREFAKAGLSVAVLGNYQNLAHPDPARLRDIQERYRAHLRFASLLGCSVVGTETGAPNADYHYDREACHSEKALQTFITNVRPVVRDAERFGVILAIEPVYKHIVWNPKRARAVLDAIDSPNLQIIFDPVNLLHPDNLDHRDEVLEEAVDLLGKDVAVLHLKDYRLEKDESGQVCMKACACGTGEMDYRSVLSFAVQRKPFLQATMENTTPENAVSARQFIERQIAEL